MSVYYLISISRRATDSIKIVIYSFGYTVYNVASAQIMFMFTKGKKLIYI